MESLIAYLSMDGYWAFVWPAYGITAIVLVALLIDSLRLLRANERAASALERGRARRSPRRATGTGDGAPDA